MELAAILLATFSSTFFFLFNFFFVDIKVINHILTSFLQIQLKLVSTTQENQTESDTKHLSWLSINSGEIKMAMANLGLNWELEGDETSNYDEKEFVRMFGEEKEICLEEVKEAFDVFDENRDGFIDVRELQRVLCILGLKNGEDCRGMIAKFDENGDGVIDFSEFLRLTEDCFS